MGADVRFRVGRVYDDRAEVVYRYLCVHCHHTMFFRQETLHL